MQKSLFTAYYYACSFNRKNPGSGFCQRKGPALDATGPTNTNQAWFQASEGLQGSKQGHVAWAQVRARNQKTVEWMDSDPRLQGGRKHSKRKEGRARFRGSKV